MQRFKKFLPALLCVLLLGVSWAIRVTRNTESLLHTAADHSMVEWQLAGENLTVEVVRATESIRQGLGGREEIAGDGMLFVFPQPGRPIFWMKDMRFPIDIVWIRDGAIIGIERNIQPPQPSVPDQELPLFTAPADVDMVLETQPGRLP